MRRSELGRRACVVLVRSRAWEMGQIAPLGFAGTRKRDKLKDLSRYGLCLVGREGFEPPKAEPADLQSAPFGHLGISPQGTAEYSAPGGKSQAPSGSPIPG